VPLVSLDRVSIAFGHLPLLDGVALQIEPRERVSVIGRNGAGKSTLLRIVNGDLQPDTGTVWRQPALKIARLDQDVPLNADRPVFDVVAEGHTHHLAEDDEWRREHQVDLVLSRLENQRQANQIFPFVMLPQFFLAGIFNPIQNLPPLLDILTKIAPMRYAVDLIRDVYYGSGSGVPIFDLPTNLAIIGAEFAVFMVLGTAGFVRAERNR